MVTDATNAASTSNSLLVPSQISSDSRSSDSRSSAISANISSISPSTSHSRSSTIIGTSNSVSSLQSVSLHRYENWIYVSRLSPSTSLEYVYKHFMDILNMRKNDISVIRLVPKDKDLKTFSFISFKIGCSLNCFDKVMCSEKWPVGIVVKEFVEIKNSLVLQP